MPTKLTLTLRTRLAKLLAQRADIAEQEKALAERKDAINAELLQYALDAGDKLDTDTHTISVVRTTRKTLSADLLLKHGVKPTIIAKATVESENRPYVKVTEKKSELASAVAKGA